MDEQRSDLDEEEAHLIVETDSDLREAHDNFDQAVERLLAGLSLPLSESLNVPPGQVASKSQEILEALIRLRQEREALLNRTAERMEEYINRFSEEERVEVRARIEVMGMLM